jgi:hypothetical protein
MTNIRNNAEPTLTNQQISAMGFRPTVVPIAVYLGASVNNAHTILTTLPPWIYLGCTLILLGIAQVVQRRRGTAWDWPVAIAVGFAIALIAWLVAIGVSNIVAPSQVAPRLS